MDKNSTDELYWRNQTSWAIELEQRKRFEAYFTEKCGHPVKWCALCRSFSIEHTHAAVASI